MLQLEPQVQATCLFVDRGGNEGRVTLRLPLQSYDSAYARATTLAIAIQSLSDALLKSITLRYRAQEDALQVAPPTGSDARTFLALFYRKGDEYVAFYIPAPHLAYLEGAGLYAGVRLDVANPDVLASVENLTLALAQTATPGIPDAELEYRAGGLAV